MTYTEQLVFCYRAARFAWADSEAIRTSAATLGMSEREYCNFFVRFNYGAILYTSTTTVPPTIDMERVWEEAKP